MNKDGAPIKQIEKVYNPAYVIPDTKLQQIIKDNMGEWEKQGRL